VLKNSGVLYFQEFLSEKREKSTHIGRKEG